MTNKPLASQERRRALAELNARIAQVEAAQGKRAAAASTSAIATGSARLADERLERMRRSRAALEQDEGS